MLKKPELLAPAGSLEKLKMAVLFGANAVYLGGQDFSLRAAAANFTAAEMLEGVEFAHSHQVKVYVTVNIYAHNSHLKPLEEYLQELASINVDGIIVSDPGILALAKRVAPGLAIHISTQASCTNGEAAKFWQQQGAERVILAREVTLADCGKISQFTDIDLEIFVHGAVCMAYSGRCLLSSFMTKRSANLGDCSQPCRWQYRLEEAKRPGSFFPIDEDKWGSYIFNSKDLCLIEYLPEIIFSGVASLKIEGRMKSAYYVANVVRVYRQAIDKCWQSLEAYLAANGLTVNCSLADLNLAKFKAEYFKMDDEWLLELGKISHRHYFSGFAFGQPNENGYVYDTTYSFRGYDFAGLVLAYDASQKRLQIEQRNHLELGDEIEIISPNQEVYKMVIDNIWRCDGEPLTKLPHPKEVAFIGCPREFVAGSIIRRPIKDENLKEMNKISR